MKLHILGSSSKGNSYLLQSTAGEVLALEAGVRFEKVKRALGYNISSIAGCCITHEHGDHAGHVQEFAKAYIPLIMTPGTAAAKGIDNYQTATLKHPARLGSFRVIAFPTKHDAEQPCGFLIHHPECGTVLFATDTYYLPNRFTGLNNIIIECNYRQDLLDESTAAGLINPARRERIIMSHMSYDTCAETLAANDITRVNNIVLCHLSGDNANAAEFSQGIARLTHKHVLCARKGLTIDFNKTPY